MRNEQRLHVETKPLFALANQFAGTGLLQIKRNLAQPLENKMVVRARGFTLIELLVVLVIVGVLTSAVTLSFNFSNPSKSVRNEALRVGLLMQMASDTAIYSRQQLGVRFHPESYEFYILAAAEEGEDAQWQVVDDERLSMREPQIEIELQVDIEGIPIILETLEEERESASDSEEQTLKPHILFLSNGEVMPDFKIRVKDLEEGRFEHQIYSGEEEPIVVEAAQ